MAIPKIEQRKEYVKEENLENIISFKASCSEWKRRGDILLIASDALLGENRALAKMLNEMACEIYGFVGGNENGKNDLAQ